jgi:hypothetical protein
MIRFLLVSVTGWIAVLALGIEAGLPYILRDRLRNALLNSPPPAKTRRTQGLLVRMWPHYWLGYALLAVVLAHTSFVMGPAMGRTDATGIWAATAAFFVLFLQIALGLVLKSGTANQRQLRRWHYRTMIAVVFFVLTHLWRNA